MKKLLCILLLLFCIIGINSQTILTLGRVKVDGLNIARSGENLLVSMKVVTVIISIYAMMLLQVWVFHCFVPVMTG